MNVLTTINVLAAKALLYIVNMDEERPHLKGVWFDSSGRAMATDGRLLLAFAGLTPIVGADVFVAGAELKEILKGAKPKATLGICEDGLYVESRKALVAPTRARDDFKMPDWVRIVPTQFNGHAAQFDSAIVEQMRHALGICEVLTDDKLPRLVCNGPGRCAIVETPDNVLALIMPLQSDRNPPDVNEAAARVLRFLGT